MTGPAPNPFPARVPNAAHLYLYVDGIDLTAWADRASLQNATLLFQQGSPETLTFKLKHYVSDNYGGTTGAQPLPPIRAGKVPVAYVYKSLEESILVEEFMFAGLVDSRAFVPEDWAGASVFTVSTPAKLLKSEITVRFFPQTEGDDILRLRALGHKWGHPLFDFSLPGYTASITFPLPAFSLASGEPTTDYVDKAVDVIIRDICTDPGNPNDTGYPVPSRDWWWEPHWVDSTDKTKGIKWSLSLVAVRDLYVVGELSDEGPEADYPDPTVFVYDRGEQIKVDYNSVIRRVVVSGAKRQYQPTNMIPTGTDHIDVPSSGWVRKVSGVDGTYDTTAVGKTSAYSDFDFHWQIQETYLVHDNFKGDDQHPLGSIASYSPVDPGFPAGRWYAAYTAGLTDAETQHNNMCRRGGYATPFKAANVGDSYAYVDAKAATCIQRVRVKTSRTGANITGRVVINANDTFHSGIVLYVNTSNEWDLYTVDDDGATWTGPLNTSGHAATDNQNIKINYKYNQIQVYFEDVIDDAYTQEDFSFNQHETLFGLGVYVQAFGTSYETQFEDFSITDYWGDKGIGIGDATTGSEWFWIGYGIVYNVNGTYTLVQGGTVKDTLGVGGFGAGTPVYTYAALNTYQATHGGRLPPDVPYLWADVLLAHNTLAQGFNYDDVYQMTTVRYQEVDASFKRKVQWWRQAGGAGQWILLREERNIDPDVIKWMPPPGTPSVWYLQVALKELGATFTNMAAVTSYSNVFLPPATMVADLLPLQGEYPATGVIQHDRLNTYIAREKVAMAVFREYGNPLIDASLTIRPRLGEAPFTGYRPTYPAYRGYAFYLRNRRAGWVNPGGGPDTRQLVIMRGIQRLEGGAQGKRPAWRLQVGNKKYSYVDPARTHLLAVGAKYIIPTNLELPELTGMSFFFADPIGGDQYYGDKTQIKVNAVGVDAAGDVPTFDFPEGVRDMQLPHGTFPPGTQYEAQHRTVAADGTPSAWSAKYSGIAPPARPYDRPFVTLHPFGDGSATISVPTDTTLIHAVQLNEACSLVAWALNINGPGGLTVDIQRISEVDLMTTGASAFASICGTGAKPNVQTYYTSHASAGSDFRDWSAVRADLKKGDFVRAVISTVDVGTTATMGMLSLTFERVRR